jgi:hypothetical protein
VGSNPGWIKSETMKLVYVYLAAKDATLRRKSKYGTGDIDPHTQNIIKSHELSVSNKDSRMSTYHTEQKCGKIARSVVILSWQIHNYL